MRTKEIPIQDGKPYTICSLTVDQVQELVFSEQLTQAVREGGVERAKKVIEGNRTFVKDRCAPIVAASFNNRIMGNGDWFARGWDNPRQTGPEDKEPEWWTPELVSSRLDWFEVSTLYKAITDFTGLQSKVETRRASEAAPQPGESPAVEPSSTELSAA